MTHSIRAGIKYLDKFYPNWEDKIDLKTLDLADHDHCILGQLHPRGHYGTGLNNAVRNRQVPFRYHIHDWAVEMGFSTNPSEIPYSKLTEKWKNAIRRRRRIKRTANA